MLLLIFTGIFETEGVDIVEESPEFVLEHPRDVGAPIVAVVHHVLHGEVGIKVELVLFYMVADALDDIVYGLLRRRVAADRTGRADVQVDVQVDGSAALRV